MRILVLVAGLVIASAGAPAKAQGEYHNHADLSAAIQQIVADHPRACVAESIGTSLEGRAIWALRLALGGDVDPDRRPAMLLVANIDGDHLVGSAVALELARQLLARTDDDDEAAVKTLTEHTLYIVPRVNPDAAEHFFAEVRSNRVRNLRPDDRDRDGDSDG